MPINKKQFMILFCLLIILVGVLSYLLQGGLSHDYFLKIRDKETDEVLTKHQVRPKKEVTLWYIHSADGTPVTQVFQVKEKGELSLLKEKYEWYGAGLETGSGLDYSVENGEVIISGYDRSFEVIPIRVANTVPQVITIGDEEIDLSEVAAGGTLLHIELYSSFSFFP